MRIEPRGVGSIIHITNRGARGMDIVRDVPDRNNFVRTLYYLNDTHTDHNWRREIVGLGMFERPASWPEREPLAQVLAWTLLSNHFHLLVQESQEGGVAKLMQRISGSISMSFNLKYKEKGGLFQSSYYSKTVDANEHFSYLVFYILVKNVLDMYPGGLVAARNNFDYAWEWAKQYQYSSFHDTISGTVSSIINDEENLISSIVGSGGVYKKEARELLDLHLTTRGEEFKDIMLEVW